MKRFLVAVCVVGALASAGCSPEPDGEALLASFTWNQQIDTVDSTTCVPREMVFHDVSTGDPESRLWEFPDGTTSEESTVRQPSDLTGLVRLTVFRGTESDTIEQDINPVTDC